MRLESYHWPKSQPLAEHYASRLDRVRGLFEHHPAEESSWRRRVEWLDGPRDSADRGALADALRAFNAKLGGAPETMAAVERLREPQALAVVGGQQAGLFTGPLLVIYKAVTLLQAARDAEERLSRPVVPVFWIAGEDHDFDEANHLYALDAQLDIRKIKIDHPGGVRTAVSRQPIAEWAEALQALDETLMPTEFKAELLARLRSFCAESATLTELFGRMMAWLFGPHGLVLIDADDPDVRRLEAAMFRRLLERREAVNGAVAAAHAEVAALGYEPQAETAEGSANLFLFGDNGERLLLHWDGNTYTDKKRERSFPTEQLLALAETSPDRFSNNVMTRPLMQDYLFPVLLTVLGPGEIAYWALTKGAFAAAGLQQPIIVPRLEFTIVEGTTQKHMDKFGLSFDDVVHRFDEMKADWLREQDALGLEERFGVVLAQFRELYDPLLRTIAGINPGLGKLGETNAQKIAEQIEFLKTRAIEAQSSQYEAALRQLERIRLSLLPFGKPQERVYNMVAYLNKYGQRWLDELVRLPYEPQRSHGIIYM